MDIEQALDSLQDYIASESYDHKKQCFMDGYRTEYRISDDELSSMLPACRRFANLYGYTRVLRSQTEIWDNEPEWLISLRGKFAKALQDNSSRFGMKL
jgi:hypothetical protein